MGWTSFSRDNTLQQRSEPHGIDPMCGDLYHLLHNGWRDARALVGQIARLDSVGAR